MLVTENGLVENRIIEVPLGMPPSALVEAGNYLNARLVGRTLDEARGGDRCRNWSSTAPQLDELTTQGWSRPASRPGPATQARAAR